MINKLKKYKINPIFIFDGKPPQEKFKTISNRKMQKKKKQLAIIRLENQLNETRYSYIYSFGE